MTKLFMYHNLDSDTVYGLDSEVGRDALREDIIASSVCAAHISQVSWKSYQIWCTFNNNSGVLYKRNKS